MKIYSKNIVLENSIVSGYIQIEYGKIVKITEDIKPSEEFIDYTDKYIIPGLVNIKSTNLCRELEEIRCNYPSSEDKVIMNIDRLCAQSGITTVYHMFNLENLLKTKSISDIVELFDKIKSKKLLIEHKIHIVFNLEGSLSNASLRDLISTKTIDFITFVWKNNHTYLDYKNQYFIQNLQSKFNIDDSEASKVLDILENSRENAAIDEISYRIKSLKNTNVEFASSSINLITKLRERYKIDIDVAIDLYENNISEKIIKNNLKYMCDTDEFFDKDIIDEYNLLIKNDIISGLYSSRYYDMLNHSITLSNEIGINKAINLISRNPAINAKLVNKGSIREGMDADLIVLDSIDGIFIPVVTISRGNIVTQYNY